MGEGVTINHALLILIVPLDVISVAEPPPPEQATKIEYAPLRRTKSEKKKGVLVQDSMFHAIRDAESQKEARTANPITNKTKKSRK